MEHHRAGSDFLPSMLCDDRTAKLVVHAYAKTISSVMLPLTDPVPAAYRRQAAEAPLPCRMKAPSRRNRLVSQTTLRSCPNQHADHALVSSWA